MARMMARFLTARPVQLTITVMPVMPFSKTLDKGIAWLRTGRNYYDKDSEESTKPMRQSYQM